MSDQRGAAGTPPEPRHPVGQAPPLDDRPIPGGAPVTPDDRWWGDVDRRHRVLIVAGVIVGVLLLASGVGVGVALIGSSLSAQDVAPSTAPVRPIPETSAAVITTLPAQSETTSTTVSTTTPAPLPVGGRARYVAYRKDGGVWVATESGEDPKRVFASTQGPYALSPDARTLAVVDGASQTLSLIDVAGGSAVMVGKAVPDRPSWAADSSFVVYTSQPPGSHDTEVDRVNRDGSGRVSLGAGYGGRVAPDGSVVAISASRTADGTPLEVISGGQATLIGEKLSPNAIAPMVGRIVFADAGGVIVSGAARQPSIRSIYPDGSGMRTLVPRPSVGEGVFFGDLMPSPDGVWIVYAETGDDGYSRLFAMKASGGAAHPLSLRRDAYIMGWSADSTEIVFVEGNAAQEEPTKLMAMRPDGSGRRTIIDGAGQ